MSPLNLQYCSSNYYYYYYYYYYQYVIITRSKLLVQVTNKSDVATASFIHLDHLIETKKIKQKNFFFYTGS
jgi:hypothetical protein